MPTRACSHSGRSAPGVDRALTGLRVMAFVIAETCIDVKDGVCTEVCPVEAIWDEDDLPAGSERFTAINAEFFHDAVTGWGAPGGLAPEFRTELDHPAVAAWEPEAT